MDITTTQVCKNMCIIILDIPLEIRQYISKPIRGEFSIKSGIDLQNCIVYIYNFQKILSVQINTVWDYNVQIFTYTVDVRR